MERLYDQYVTRYSDSFIRVFVDQEYVIRIKSFVKKIIEAKSKETHHKIDSLQEEKRFTTGFLGEAALEKLLGIPIIDWSIGNSDFYNNPDIPGYKVGIKTVERNKFPIIFKNNGYPQIICIKSIQRDDLVFVCGLATTKVLNEYQDDNLILDPNLLDVLPRASPWESGHGNDSCTPKGVLRRLWPARPVRPRLMKLGALRLFPLFRDTLCLGEYVHRGVHVPVVFRPAFRTGPFTDTEILGARPHMSAGGACLG